MFRPESRPVVLNASDERMVAELLGTPPAAPARLTDEELAEIEARVGAATSGPWYRNYGDVIVPEIDPRDNFTDEPRDRRIVRAAAHRTDMRDPQAIADAAFIAAARSDVPRLLAAVRGQGEALRRAEQERADLVTAMKLLAESCEREDGPFPPDRDDPCYSINRNSLLGQAAGWRNAAALMERWGSGRRPGPFHCDDASVHAPHWHTISRVTGVCEGVAALDGPVQ